MVAHAAPLMLVEDEPIFALALLNELEDAKFSVRLCSSGNEAFTQLAAEREFAALVTDIDLGEGPSGWEVARFARAKFPAIAVIYVTGSGSTDHALFGTAGSILLEKPFDPRRLVSTLLGRTEHSALVPEALYPGTLAEKAAPSARDQAVSRSEINSPGAQEQLR